MSPVELPACLPLNEGDLQFRDRFRGWLEDNAPREPEPADRKAKYDFGRRWQRTLAESGWCGVSWPKEFGGLGAGPVRRYLYYDELGRAGAPDFPNRPGLILLAPTLMAYGDEEIQTRYLPGLLTADEIWAQCFSEPDAGSDLASLRTRARLVDGSFYIDGQKTWVTAGDFATYAAVLCRTGAPEGRHRTLTLLLVALDQPGVEVRPIRAATGDTGFCEIFFNDARTPASHAVGGLNRGWEAAMMMLEYERGDWTFTDHRPFFARIARIWYELDANERVSPGSRRTAELRERLGLAWVRTHQLRELNISLMFRVASDESVGAWGSPVKAFWGELNQLICDIELDASDLMPGLDSPELQGYLAGRMSTVYSGAIDIQRSVVAERLLGIPRLSNDWPETRPSTLEATRA